MGCVGVRVGDSLLLPRAACWVPAKEGMERQQKVRDKGVGEKEEHYRAMFCVARAILIDCWSGGDLGAPHHPDPHCDAP